MASYVYKIINLETKEIIYIGKTDSGLPYRMKMHKQSGKFNNYKWLSVYYSPVSNATESDIMEKALINKYKPELNIKDKCPESISISFDEPYWYRYNDVNWTGCTFIEYDYYRNIFIFLKHFCNNYDKWIHQDNYMYRTFSKDFIDLETIDINNVTLFVKEEINDRQNKYIISMDNYNDILCDRNIYFKFLLERMKYYSNDINNSINTLCEYYYDINTDYAISILKIKRNIINEFIDGFEDNIRIISYTSDINNLMTILSKDELFSRVFSIEKENNIYKISYVGLYNNHYYNMLTEECNLIQHEISSLLNCKYNVVDEYNSMLDLVSKVNNTNSIIGKNLLIKYDEYLDLSYKYNSVMHLYKYMKINKNNLYKRFVNNINSYVIDFEDGTINKDIKLIIDNSIIEYSIDNSMIVISKDCMVNLLHFIHKIILELEFKLVSIVKELKFLYELYSINERTLMISERLSYFRKEYVLANTIDWISKNINFVDKRINECNTILAYYSNLNILKDFYEKKKMLLCVYDDSSNEFERIEQNILFQIEECRLRITNPITKDDIEKYKQRLKVRLEDLDEFKMLIKKIL